MKSLHLLQAEYWQSEKSLESARNIIFTKCYNMRHLAHAFASNRTPLLRKKLSAIEHEILAIASSLEKANSKREVMLLEARATKWYWKSFKVLANAPHDWKRMTSKSNDELNRLLAVGYHWLFNTIRLAVNDSGCTTKIGVLHSPNNDVDALVYDLEEIFRQPIVDRTLLAILARRDAHRVSPGLFVNELIAKWSDCEWHKGKLKPWDEVLESEIVALKKSILAKKPYAPASMPWTHKSKKKRPPKES